MEVCLCGKCDGELTAIDKTAREVEEESKNKKEFSVTDKNMTRFWISVDDALKFVLNCLDEMKGGEIFIPKLQSIKILEYLNLFKNQQFKTISRIMK